MQLLLEAGADVHRVAVNGQNALFKVCEWANDKTKAELLLSVGAILPLNYFGNDGPHRLKIQRNFQAAQAAVLCRRGQRWSRSIFQTWPDYTHPFIWSVLLAAGRFALVLPSEVWEEGIFPYLKYTDFWHLFVPGQ